MLDQMTLPGLPAPARCCLRCGEAIPAPKRVGRPLMFCGSTCREAQASAQVTTCTATRTATDRPTAIICDACGNPFPTPPKGAGRWPHWCSPECTNAGKQKRTAGYRLKRAKTPQPKAGGEGQKSDTPSGLDRWGSENFVGASFRKVFS